VGHRIAGLPTVSADQAQFRLHVVSASDSFESFWPQLTSELGIGLALARSASEARDTSTGVVVVNAAGAEHLLPELLRGTADLSVPVICVGVDEGRRIAVEAVRAGARDYFCLPAEVDALRAFVRAAMEDLGAREGVDQFVAAQQRRHRFDGIFGNSAAMFQAIARAERVIPHDKLTLLLTGETGTGKEVFARAIHYNGPRKHMPFVAINCAAIPKHLLESELFGHERGAFTGAHAAKPGLFEVADGGTLLLDEIGHLDLTLQGKLLRALEERTIRRVGGAKDSRVDVRVLAATHVNLGRAAERGEFRSDLYYRLNVVSITLPPLRERDGDALLLADHFMRKTASEYGVNTPKLSPSARAVIERYHWPGNVRELRNAMERATLLANNGVVQASDLELDEERPVTSTGAIPFPASLSTIVRSAVRATVELSGGNKSAAARRLGISRSRLLRITGGEDDFSDPAE
jgi:DNA-binding NtrC family response regulator